MFIAAFLLVSCAESPDSGDSEFLTDLLVSVDTKSASNGFTYPLTSLTSWGDTNYGYCGTYPPYYITGYCHIGSDLGATAYTTPVYPVSAGKIVWISGNADATCSSGWGYSPEYGTCNQAIIAQHYDATGTTFYAIYGHLLRSSRAINDNIYPDTPLGYIGKYDTVSGAVISGSHLHFGVWSGSYPTTNLGRTSCSSSYGGYTFPSSSSTYSNGTVAPLAYIGARRSVVPPSAPSLSSPASGASVSSPVSFSWVNGSGDYRSHIMVCTNSTLTSGCFNPDGAMTGAEPSSPFATSYSASLSPGTYYWAVRGIGFLDYGGWGSYSAVRSFTVR